MTLPLAQLVMHHIGALAQISEDADQLTRTFASPAMRRANELVGSWMGEAGMAVRIDAIGNLIGHYPAAQPDGKILLLGSHLDTVRDAVRQAAGTKLVDQAKDLGEARAVGVNWEQVQQTSAVVCDRRLTTLMESAVQRQQQAGPRRTSGAGHDAAALSAICPVTMLFVRCRGGLSHHPGECATEADVRVATGVMNEFLRLLAQTPCEHGRSTSLRRPTWERTWRAVRSASARRQCRARSGFSVRRGKRTCARRGAWRRR